MRPQVQALISKLREMKTVQEPGAAEELIWDLAYQQLYDKKQEVRLANIAARLTHLWVSMRHNEDLFGPPEPKTLEQAAQLPLGDTDIAGGPDLDSAVLKASIQSQLTLHYPTRTRDNMVKCFCNRVYSNWELWANHVRIHIWRVMKDEFPPIGSTND